MGYYMCLKALIIITSAVMDVSVEEDWHPSDEWLGAVARGTMETYVDNVLLIPSLSFPAAQQLVTDIGRPVV